MRTAKRQIARFTGTDKLARQNNASAVILEFTSSRRVATLAQIPTKEELLDAIDTYRTLLGEKDLEKSEVLARMRRLVETWTPCAEVPAEIVCTVRDLEKAFGGLEPPAGWDAYDGYPETWGREPTPATGAAPAAAVRNNPSPRAAEGMERVIQSAAAVMAGVNLAALLASPRVWAKAAPAWPSREHVIEHLDEYLAALDRVAPTGAADQPPVESSKAAVQRLRLLCETWEPAPAVPPEIINAARAVLAAFGMPEPPDGGWDAFDGSPAGVEEPRVDGHQDP